MSGADHYEVLNVSRTATPAEIKSAYRKLALQVHPDQGGNAALFRLVQEAWSTLSDPAKRAAYDRSLDRTSDRSNDRPAPPQPAAPEPEPQWTWSTDQPWSNEPEAPVQTGPVGPVLAYPTFGHWRIPGLVALLAYTGLIVTILAMSSYHGFWDYALGVATAAMIVVAFPPYWSRRIPLHRPLKAIGVLTAVGFLATLFVHSDLTGPGRALVVAVVAGMVVVRVLTGLWSKSHALDAAIDRDATFEFNLWGRPGEPLVNDALSAPISSYDVMLQRRTANLLDPVLNALPAAKLVHGAQLGAMVVDHLLLNGHRAALILSQVGPPGTYAVDPYGGLQLDGQPVDSAAPALEGAVEAWRGRLRPVDVRGFLIIHPEPNGRVSTQPRAGAAVTCLSARFAARDLTAWLQPEGGKVDRKVLYDILHRAPYGLR
ncbi:MAG: J domain-containing protein [Kribbellaceae bacterium]|nr:J domain-containing protein [Kribbellaceae bacterium]